MLLGRLLVGGLGVLWWGALGLSVLVLVVGVMTWNVRLAGCTVRMVAEVPTAAGGTDQSQVPLMLRVRRERVTTTMVTLGRGRLDVTAYVTREERPITQDPPPRFTPEWLEPEPGAVYDVHWRSVVPTWISTKKDAGWGGGSWLGVGSFGVGLPLIASVSGLWITVVGATMTAGWVLVYRARIARRDGRGKWKDRCTRCGYPKTAGQTRCSECGGDYGLRGSGSLAD